MLRFLFVALVVYLGYRFLKGLFSKQNTGANVSGQQKNKPLDLRDSDVEDAKFRDIDENGSKK